MAGQKKLKSENSIVLNRQMLSYVLLSSKELPQQPNNEINCNY